VLRGLTPRQLLVREIKTATQLALYLRLVSNDLIASLDLFGGARPKLEPLERSQPSSRELEFERVEHRGNYFTSEGRWVRNRSGPSTGTLVYNLILRDEETGWPDVIGSVVLSNPPAPKYEFAWKKYGPYLHPADEEGWRSPNALGLHEIRIEEAYRHLGFFEQTIAFLRSFEAPLYVDFVNERLAAHFEREYCADIEPLALAL